MKKILAPVMLLASLVIAMTGCSAPATSVNTAPVSVEEYIAVCIYPETQNRVDDDYCEEGDDDFNPYFQPYFYPYGYMIPALGFMVYGGYANVNGAYYTGFSEKGGSSVKFKPKTNRLYPKGFVVPQNATFKPSKPTATQAPAPKGMSKTPAPHPTNVPVAPKVAKTTAPAKTVAPAPAKTVAPAPAKKTTNPYKAPSVNKGTTTKSNPYKAPSKKRK